MTELWTYHRNCRVPTGQSLPDGVRRFAALIEYDGSSCSGWQRQAHCPSLQQYLETALSRVADVPIVTVCAGRTDTGVHATAQVVHFDSSTTRTARNWLLGANANLPRFLRLRWVNEVTGVFHARFSAWARTYRYVIHNAPAAPALLRDYTSWERRPLAVAAMQEAGRMLIGEHDFSAFQGAGCQSPTPWRHLSDLRVWRQGALVVIEVTANAFLLHMVRNLAGALVAVGRGDQPPQWLETLLASRQRALGPATAVPGGLYLVGVHYPPACGVPALVGGPDFLAIPPPPVVTQPLWQRDS